MKEQNSHIDLVAQWRNGEIGNPAGPLFITSQFSEGDIICETCEGCSGYCGTACTGSVTRYCC
jgi:hypothetical protein